MSTSIKKRIATLETATSPKEGIADAIRRAYREMVAGMGSVGDVGGRIASDIRKARAEHLAKGA